jgi:hypothetical protein
VHLPATAARQVTLEYPAHGGHVGFANGSLPGQLDWLPRKLLHFLEGKSGSRAPTTDELCEADAHG